MKRNKRNDIGMKIFSFASLYLMMVMVFLSGIIITPRSELVAANEMLLESPIQNNKDQNNEINEPTIEVITDTEMARQESEIMRESTQTSEQPTLIEKLITIKSNVGGLNIREDKSTNSRVIGVMYNEEIAIARVHIFNDETILEQDWIELSNGGYVHADYIRYIDDYVNLDEYQLTDKGTYIKNPILSDSVIQKSYVTTACISELTEGTSLSGIEQAIVDVEQEYGINGLFVYAVARLESSSGTSAIAQDKNNLFGMNAQDHDPYNLAYSYPSFYESIYDFARRIKTYYIDRGYITLDDINTKYSTDPNWHSKIYSIMSEAYTHITN